MTSDEASRVNIEIELRLSQIASYNAIRIKEFTRLFELDSDSVIMYDIMMYHGPLAEPVIYTILFKYSRSCAILSVAKRFVTIFYLFTQFWIVGNKYFKNITRCVFVAFKALFRIFSILYAS